MTSFSYFCDNSKLRHDFSDQFQVRYLHSNGKPYDTWVSGEEALQRLASRDAEEQLNLLLDLDWDKFKQLKNNIPNLGKDTLEQILRERLSNAVKDLVGRSFIGDNLVSLVRGDNSQYLDNGEDESKWKALLSQEQFRFMILSLAWIQMRGSFPETTDQMEPDDWV
jgi:hypothetical protein